MHHNTVLSRNLRPIPTVRYTVGTIVFVVVFGLIPWAPLGLDKDAANQSLFGAWRDLFSLGIMQFARMPLVVCWQLMITAICLLISLAVGWFVACILSAWFPRGDH